MQSLSDENILIESLIENLQREDLTSLERETAIKELWDTKKYKTKADLGKKLGYKSESRIAEILGAIEFREKYMSDKKFSEEVSTRTIVDTIGLDDELRVDLVKKVTENKINAQDVQKIVSEVKKAPEDTRKAIIDKVASEEVPLKDLSNYVEDLKKVPQPIRKAIIENKVDYEDVKPHIATVESRPEIAKQFVEEFSIKKQDKEAYRQAQIEREDALIKKKIEPTFTKYEPSPDEKRFKEFDEVYVKVHYWQWFDISAIKDATWRAKTIDRLRQIRDHVDALLRKLEEQRDLKEIGRDGK